LFIISNSRKLPEVFGPLVTFHPSWTGKAGRNELSEIVSRCVHSALRARADEVEDLEIDADDVKYWKGDIVGGLEAAINSHTAAVIDEWIQPGPIRWEAKRRLNDILSECLHLD